MKKLLTFSLVSFSFLLAGCQEPVSTSITLDSTPQARTGGEYQYTFQMQQPDLADSTNREAMISGVKEARTLDYKITEDEVNSIKEYCTYEEATPWIATNHGSRQEIPRDKLVAGNTFTLTGERDSYGGLLTWLTAEEKNQISERGWTIVPLERLNNYRLQDYDPEAGEYPAYNSEERVNVTDYIAGSELPSERYAFNSPLITEDLLLHIYHKLFSNSLKYYEEQVARPTLEKLASKLSSQYANLAQKEQNAELKEIYDFLAAYRTVPQIFLIPEETLRQEINKNFESYETDLTDEQIKDLITTRANELTKNLFPTYQNLIPKVVDQILKAEEDRALDSFMMALGGDFFKQSDIEIQQDYTQFQPRSHYNDSSLLKTYFLATKWLMREKFYFNSPELTKAAMLMASTISESDLKEFNELSNQIKNLIGQDDDLTLQEMRDFLKTKKLTTAKSILDLQNFDEILTEVSALHPQRIASTHYKTPDCFECIAEDEAKQLLDGFVFFGEKFTLDSFIFDQMTAGSAEEEFTSKPNLQTAFIVPDILAKSDLAHQFVQLRMEQKSKLNPPKIFEGSEFSQISSYDKHKSETQDIIANLTTSTPNIIDNLYHKRLSLIEKLLASPLENAPYFRLDPLYQIKSLITYMGSYTELKHDTLLYVKQAYAEMGAGGDDACTIYVDPPALPVPKGYIEAEPDFLDQLILLVDQTIPYFKGTYSEAQYLEFSKALKKLKEIAIHQIHNETISDEDFEWMRTELIDQLEQIVIPIKTFGSVSQKETRGAIIADIFTSEQDGPLYEAVGRPALMILNVSDTNGTRTVLGPIFTHYEFYASDEIIQDAKGGRYTDQDRQTQLFNEEFREYANPKPIPNRSNKGLDIASQELMRLN